VGVVFCSYAIWWLVLTPFTGRLVDRLGTRLPLLIGLGLGIVGMLLLAVSASSERLGLVVGALTLCAFGTAFAVPATNAFAFANVAAQWRGEASGINMTLRLVGSIVGLAIAGRVIASNVDSSAGAGLAHSAVRLWVLGAALLAVAFVVAVSRAKDRNTVIATDQSPTDVSTE
jgi:MFS family permease